MSAVDIWIYGLIGADFGGVDAGEVVRTIEANRGADFSVHVNSPGGVAVDGTAIHNALSRWGGRVTVDVEGEALSAATTIVMAGHRRRMASNAVFMIHRPWFLVAGDEDALRKEADVLAKYTESSIDTYAKATGLTNAKIRQLMVDETYMSPKEAKTLGFVTEVVDPREFDAAVAVGPRLPVREADAAHVPKVAAAYCRHLNEKMPEWAKQSRQGARMRAVTVQRFGSMPSMPRIP